MRDSEYCTYCNFEEALHEIHIPDAQEGEDGWLVVRLCDDCQWDMVEQAVAGLNLAERRAA